MDFGSNLSPDPTEARLAVIRLISRSDKTFARRSRTFGDDDDCEMLARLLPLADFVANAFVIERNLRNQNRVGAARKSRIDGDPTGISPHDLENHYAAVALRRAVQAIDGIGRTSNGRIEAKRHHRRRQIVIDRLRDADNRDSMLEHLLRDRQRAITADRYQADQPKLLTAAFGFVQ